MPLYKFANVFTTNLTAGISSAATSMTIDSVLGLPAVGSLEALVMRIRPVDSVTPYELVYVTAIAGSVLTIQRGRESTAALAWDTGALVECVASAAALANLNDRIGCGANNAKPSTGTPGRIWLPNDSPVGAYDNGTAWRPLVGYDRAGVQAPPTTSTFPTVWNWNGRANGYLSGGVSYNASTGRNTNAFYAVDSLGDAGCVYWSRYATMTHLRSLPSTNNFKVVIGFIPFLHGNCQQGIVISGNDTSGGGQMLGMFLEDNNTLQLWFRRFNNQGSSNAGTFADSAGYVYRNATPIYMRIRFNRSAGFYYFDLLINGYRWYPVARLAFAATTDVNALNLVDGPIRWGFFQKSIGDYTFLSAAHIMHWFESTNDAFNDYSLGD